MKQEDKELLLEDLCINKLDCIVYKVSKWERLAAKIFPYYIPFIHKRRRVKIRQYWRNRWRRKLHNDLCKVLSEIYLKGLPEPTKEIKWYDWEWEIVTNNNSYET